MDGHKLRVQILACRHRGQYLLRLAPFRFSSLLLAPICGVRRVQDSARVEVLEKRLSAWRGEVTHGVKHSLVDEAGDVE